MATVYKEFGLDYVMKEGDLGVEIEVEGKRLPFCESYWRNEEDGSLKGEESREYVLLEPMSLKGVRNALDYLDTCYKATKAVVDDTVRAGVHVHVNCQRLTLTELYNFMTIYLVLENVMVKWCGDYREGNLFCLRASDAEWVLSEIKKSTTDGRRDLRRRFHRDELRYASMNLKALGDYGSIEFRAMRGTRDLDLIYTWAESLLGLREYAKKFNSPSSVIEAFSIHGAVGFMKLALGSNCEKFICKDVEKLLFQGMRNAQDVAYCCDWLQFDPPVRSIGGCEFPVTMKSEEINEPLEDF